VAGLTGRKEVLVTKRWTIVAGTLLLLMLTVVPGAVAKTEGTERPFGGEMTGVLTFEFDWTDPVCPVTTVTDATGTLSHFGIASSHWTHCPPVLEGQTAYTNGHVTFTAANGDEIIGEYSDADGDAPFVIAIVGGSGRFAEASGTIVLSSFNAIGEWGEDGLPIQPWYWDGVLTGSISY
jgi:hypothetical protein